MDALVYYHLSILWKRNNPEHSRKNYKVLRAVRREEEFFYYPHGCLHFHRRTGNFLPGGAVNHLPKKFSEVAQIFTKRTVEKKRGPYYATT